MNTMPAKQGGRARVNLHDLVVAASGKTLCGKYCDERFLCYNGALQSISETFFFLIYNDKNHHFSAYILFTAVKTVKFT